MSDSIDLALRALIRDVVREELRAHATRRSGADAPPTSTATGDVAYVSTRRAAQIADVHPATIRDWVRRGLLQEHRAGRGLRVRCAELHALMDRFKKGTGEVVDLDARADEILSKSRRRATRSE